ncbi:MAG: acyl carrier protein [Gemmatimonadetes bacterium]|nr:acyl carrier protein [Gemmatimonadota bacterium]MYF72046.1 acyl carrier protein [Gemmatimonadota bacterium]MYK51066.1 acyl carrier protein [Gemmatimonadota bacterium]
MSIEHRVKQVIIRTLSLEVDADEIDDEDELFGGGLGINSMATIEIIVGLEEEFGIEVPDEDLRVELFDSVQTMADYIRAVLQKVPEVAGQIE